MKIDGAVAAKAAAPLSAVASLAMSAPALAAQARSLLEPARLLLRSSAPQALLRAYGYLASLRMRRCALREWQWVLTLQTAFCCQELGQVAGEVNILGVIAVALFIIIPGERRSCAALSREEGFHVVPAACAPISARLPHSVRSLPRALQSRSC